jgi:hypothetical protein
VNTEYITNIYTPASTADFALRKMVAGTLSTLGTEAVDLSGITYLQKISCSGSTIKAFRVDMTTPKITVTDTSIASGLFGTGDLPNTVGSEPVAGTLRAPASVVPQAQIIVELPVEGNGKFDDPYRPSLSKSLVEIASLIGLPDFLYAEAKKYDVLKAKGFTDDEIKTLFGYIPQHQVDLDAVTWGAFEFHPDKAPTAIVVITGDNPYKSGAIERQIAFAKKRGLTVLPPPKDYNEAVEQYYKLKDKFPHWLAGKDNYAYQTLGNEVFELFANADFYYGELIEHKTHYDQLAKVPESELRRRIEEIYSKLKKVDILTYERDKHLKKLKAV